MNIRIYNAQILTMQTTEILKNAELWVQGEIITHIGAHKDENVTWDREIDANNNLIMPGFKNAHTHSAMTFLRSYADDLPLLDWLKYQVFPMEDKLQPQHIKPLVKLAIMEYLSSGITACFDMYMFTQEMAQASIETGFRTVLCGCFSKYVTTVDMLEQQHIKYSNMHPLVTHKLGFHAEYTTDKSLLIGIAALAKKHNASLYTHGSESLSETNDCIARTGQTPTKYMTDLGLFDNGGAFYHGVYLTDDDIELCKKHNIAVVSNPGSNTKLASGIAPLVKLKEKGITLALGTDGAASNNCLDFFREMFLACGLQKLQQKDAAAMPAIEVLKMATTGSAKVMGLDNCDVLANGKFADIIMINLHRPNMQPINNVINNLVYSGSKENVKLTIVNGKILYEDGKFYIGENDEEIYKAANEIIESFK